MKKLITTNTGGFPLVLDDIRFMNQGFQESMIALASPYVKYSDVAGLLQLSGFETTVNSTSPLNHTIGSGYILINDEVYFCGGLAAHDIVSGSGYRVKVVTEYDVAGDKLFQSGMRHDTYANRYAELIYEPLSTTTAGSFSFPTKSVMGAVYDYMQEGLERVKIKEDTLYAEEASLYAYKDFSKVKHLSGRGLVSFLGAYNYIPSTYRPIQDIIVLLPVVGAFDNSEYYVLSGMLIAKLYTTGRLETLHYNGEDARINTLIIKVSFDNISYL